jgi:hypothetical protein
MADTNTVKPSPRQSIAEECGQTSLPQVLASSRSRCSERLKPTLGPSESEIHACDVRKKQEVTQLTQFAVTNLKPINLCHFHSFSQ